MELIVLGSSPAVPNPGGACSGYLLRHGRQQLLVDCGHGVVGVLRTITDLADLSAIIVSHVHPDHVFDLVPLAYGFRFGHIPPIPLYLPPGGISFLQRLQAATDLEENFFSDLFVMRTYDPGSPLAVADLTINFAPTRHFVPAYAMRFTATSGSRALVYSSDTGWSKPVLELSRGATLALIEASVVRYETEHEADGHLSAGLAGELARAAAVERLVITHYPVSNAEETRRVATEAFGKGVVLARERDRFEI